MLLKKQLLTALLFFSSIILMGKDSNQQEAKYPIFIEKGALYSQWKINKTLDAKIFLESAYPKIIFDEKFVLDNIDVLGVKLIPETANLKVSFWSDGIEHDVKYLIRDSLNINGRMYYLDALVVDMASFVSDGRDILFPINDLKEAIELNVSEKYMSFLGGDPSVGSDYLTYDISSIPDNPKFHGLKTTLEVISKDEKTAKLSGVFLLDLGAGNSFFLNTRNEEVVKFIQDAGDMRLADSEKYNPGTFKDFSIILPHKIRLQNLEIVDDVASKTIVASLFPTARNGFVGVIGVRFFSHFSVILDYQNLKVHLKPLSEQVIIIQ